MKPLWYLPFDLETTGLDITRDEPIQIYMGAARKDGEIKDEILLHCWGTQEISPGAEKVHGFSMERIKEIGEPARLVTPKLTKFIWNHQPAILICHNGISFDFPMLQNWFVRYTEGRFKHPPIAGIYDTMHMSNIILGGTKWRKLEVLAQVLEIPTKDLHDAKTDVEVMWRCFLKLEKMRQK